MSTENNKEQITVIDLPLTEIERDQILCSVAFQLVELASAVRNLAESLQIMLTLDQQNITPGRG